MLVDLLYHQLMTSGGVFLLDTQRHFYHTEDKERFTVFPPNSVHRKEAENWQRCILKVASKSKPGSFTETDC